MVPQQEDLAPLLSLPNETLLEITNCLPVKDLGGFRLLNRRCNDLAYTILLEYLESGDASFDTIRINLNNGGDLAFCTMMPRRPIHWYITRIELSVDGPCMTNIRSHLQAAWTAAQDFTKAFDTCPLLKEIWLV